MQADLLSLSRSSLYYQPALPPAEEVALKHRIDEIYTAWPFYGSRRITAQLTTEGMTINRKTVQRHMREMGIAGIAPGPNLSRRHKAHTVYPYLLRGVTAQAPNHIWGCDITSIRLRGGWLYLVAIIDWYSRYIVDYELSSTLDKSFVLSCLKRAMSHRKPEIINSDQGGHFTNPDYILLLESAGVKISMDGRGQCLDNARTERFFRTLKYDRIYVNEYSTPRELRQMLNEYMKSYNTYRPHSSLAGACPLDVYSKSKLIVAA
mgnify:CR=1 FL=1